MVKQGGGNVINIGSHNDEGMLGGCSVYGITTDLPLPAK
jgi:hypothetical protein